MIYRRALLFTTIFFLILSLSYSQFLDDDFLFIVGDVQENSVRILYENSPYQANETTQMLASVYQISNSNSTDINIRNPIFETTIILELFPKILKVTNLIPFTHYRVNFTEIHQHISNIVVNFRTMPPSFLTTETLEKQKKLLSSSSSTTSLKILFVSCNRYFEDEDEIMLQQIADDEADRMGIIHLGDQIYADIISKTFEPPSSSSTVTKNATILSHLIEEYRRIYRKTWSSNSMKRLLRNGFNWMFPDDHDLISNLDSHHVNPQSKFYLVVLAGRLAFYQYQLQLMHDIPVELGGSADMVNLVSKGHLNSKMDDLDLKIYQFRKLSIGFGRTIGFMMMDFRAQRAFHYDEKYPLLGRTQTEVFNETLKYWAVDNRNSKNNDKVEHILIFMQIPGPVLTTRASQFIYWFEKEKYASHPDLLNSSLSFLDTLLPFSHKVTLIGGDSHHYYETSICRKSPFHGDSDICLRQVVSSGLTRKSTVSAEIKLYLFGLILRYLDGNTVGPWKMYHSKTFLAQNYGIINIHLPSTISHSHVNGNSNNGEGELWIDIKGGFLRLDPVKDRKILIMMDILENFGVYLMGATTFLIAIIVILLLFCQKN